MAVCHPSQPSQRRKNGLALIYYIEMATVTIRAKLLVILIGWWTLLSQSASSFDLSLLPRSITIGRRLTTSTRHHETHHTSSFNLSASSSSNNNVFWTPRDLTKDNPGFVPIPPSDYIKKYQASPELWPVEFFVIAYRHINNVTQKKHHPRHSYHHNRMEEEK